MDCEKIKQAATDAELMYDESKCRHLCAVCGNMPFDRVRESTFFVHPCPFMDEMTDGYSTEDRFDQYGLTLIDNGGGFYVTSCGFFKNRPGRYDTYIGSSKAWKEKRAAVLERDHYRCKICGSCMDLHVHHVTYERLYHEELDDLITLCGKCHRRLHVYNRAKLAAISQEA